jgi:serine/threonine-protein kinase HipA
MPFDGFAHPAARPIFDHLHGVFNDALPDGWGLLLMERAFKQYKQLDRAQITPLDRLAYLGDRCMGALTYEPVLWPNIHAPEADLLALANESMGVMRGEVVQVLESLRVHGGSPGGARPKVTLAFTEDMNHCQSSYADLPENYSHWMVKFRDDSLVNGEPIDTGRVEMAYAQMACVAGLDIPKTHLLELTVNGNQEAYFAVQRFDRVRSQKIHVLSLAGYAYANHRLPSMDYGGVLLPATKKLTLSKAEIGRAFRLMVFNVLAHNKDDHSKNFAYLMDPVHGSWKLSPAFDLTFNHGMNGQHTTSINGTGQPGFEDIKQVAMSSRIENWQSIVEEVRVAVARWAEFASQYDVGASQTKDIARALQGVDRQTSQGGF